VHQPILPRRQNGLCLFGFRFAPGIRDLTDQRHVFPDATPHRLQPIIAGQRRAS
jgi:hypothetical protein